MRLGLAQLNSTVGDVAGNRQRIVETIDEARARGVDLVMFPELAITGYPPEDLLLRPTFVHEARRELDTVAHACKGIAALVGFPNLDRDLFNACAVCHDGAVKAVYHKRFLPNYGVFDEHRYFQSGRQLTLLELGDSLVGPTVCEDIWQPGPPATDLALAGAHVIANISASPFHVGKGNERERMLSTRARDNACWIAFVNAVGGQDELVFDGHSLVVDEEGEIVARAPAFEEALLVVDVDTASTVSQRLRETRRRGLLRERGGPPATTLIQLGAPGVRSDAPARMHATPLADLEEMRQALVLGLADYARKNGFTDVVIGISGGIDSALTAALAVDALGPERVALVSMPSRFSSTETQADARLVAETLGTRFLELPIEPAVEAFSELLKEPFRDTEVGVAEENIQARIRGTLLMALSNKFGWLLLATGNKSEYSVGYATLYGDMAGGFALIKDVYKTDVFRLARHLNERGDQEIVPVSTIDRPPSAELRADQRDDDSLPPYEQLDAVLEAYVEQDRSRDEIIAAGHAEEVVDRAIRLTDLAEYKRRQAPPGVKLRPKAFGRDRRLPITNAWRSW